MRMVRTLVLVIACGGMTQGEELKHARPRSVGMSEQRLERLDEVISSAIERGETPGAVVLVARRGKVVYEKAFGHRALLPHREKMTVDTIFDLASLTKVVATATSVMVLVEEGKLSLREPVAAHLPAFAQGEKGSITVLHLVTHYSGLRPDLDLDQPWQGYQTAIRKACEEKLVAPPGERFIYSDINYLLLSEVIRKVSGSPLDEWAAEKIFQPLKMEHTTFNPPAPWVPRIAPSQRREGRMLRGQVHDPTASRMGGVAGHAGLFSTARDIAVYGQMILNGGDYDEVRILSPLGVVKMTTSQSPPGQLNWRGLGFDIQTPFSVTRGDVFPIGSFGHTGFTGTSLWIDPYTQTLVILLTNRLHPDGKGDVGPLRQKVSSVVAASIVDLATIREHYTQDD